MSSAPGRTNDSWSCQHLLPPVLPSLRCVFVRPCVREILTRATSVFPPFFALVFPFKPDPLGQPARQRPLLLCLVLPLLLLLLLHAPFVLGLTGEQAAPRIAHPPNQVHLDKRFGVLVEPGFELFTGDTVVLTVEDSDAYDGSNIFRTWGLDKLGQVTCRDPTADAGTYGAAYNTDSTGGWAPSLANMWVVNVVDGRLGELSLSPVVTFPNSPKYLQPQPLHPRSGVSSSIGSAGWAPGAEEVMHVGGFLPPGAPMFAYGLHFRVQEEEGYGGAPSYGYSQTPVYDYGFTPYNHKSSSGMPMPGAGNGYGGGYNGGANYDSGRIAIRGSAAHDFCSCTGGYVRCRYLGSSQMLFPDPKMMEPVFSWFRVTKIPSVVVRRMMENYQAAVSNGLPRTFLLFSSLPFTDRVDAVHYHGAEAQLSSRRVFLGQARVVTRGTRLEQQSTTVIENTITDAITFTVDVGFAQEGALAFSDFPAIIFPFSAADSGARHSTMAVPTHRNGNASAPIGISPTGDGDSDTGGGGGAVSTSLGSEPSEFAIERDRQVRQAFQQQQQQQLQQQQLEQQMQRQRQQKQQGGSSLRGKSSTRSRARNSNSGLSRRSNSGVSSRGAENAEGYAYPTRDTADASSSSGSSSNSKLEGLRSQRSQRGREKLRAALKQEQQQLQEQQAARIRGQGVSLELEAGAQEGLARGKKKQHQRDTQPEPALRDSKNAAPQHMPKITAPSDNKGTGSALSNFDSGLDFPSDAPEAVLPASWPCAQQRRMAAGMGLRPPKACAPGAEAAAAAAAAAAASAETGQQRQLVKRVGIMKVKPRQPFSGIPVKRRSASTMSVGDGGIGDDATIDPPTSRLWDDDEGSSEEEPPASLLWQRRDEIDFVPGASGKDAHKFRNRLLHTPGAAAAAAAAGAGGVGSAAGVSALSDGFDIDIDNSGLEDDGDDYFYDGEAEGGWLKRLARSPARVLAQAVSVPAQALTSAASVVLGKAKAAASEVLGGSLWALGLGSGSGSSGGVSSSRSGGWSAHESDDGADAEDDGFDYDDGSYDADSFDSDDIDDDNDYDWSASEAGKSHGGDVRHDDHRGKRVATLSSPSSESSATGDSSPDGGSEGSLENLSGLFGRGGTLSQTNRARALAADNAISPAMRAHARKMKTMQTPLPLLAGLTLGEKVVVNFGWTFLYQTIIAFGGEYSLVVPPNTAHIGHIVHHLGYSHIPFSIDLVRQEGFWPGQWIGDMHLPPDPVSTVDTDRFSILSDGSSGSESSLSPRAAAKAGWGGATLRAQTTAAVGGGTLHALNRTGDGVPLPTNSAGAAAAAAAAAVAAVAGEGEGARAALPLFSSSPSSQSHDSAGSQTGAGARTSAKPAAPPRSFMTMQNSGFLTDFCVNPFLESDPVPFTVRGASVEMDLYSLVNPLGLEHPAYELHHFAISGTYSATNTFFVEFVIERTS